MNTRLLCLNITELHIEAEHAVSSICGTLIEIQLSNKNSDGTHEWFSLSNTKQT